MGRLVRRQGTVIDIDNDQRLTFRNGGLAGRGCRFVDAKSFQGGNDKIWNYLFEPLLGRSISFMGFVYAINFAVISLP